MKHQMFLKVENATDLGAALKSLSTKILCQKSVTGVHWRVNGGR